MLPNQSSGWNSHFSSYCVFFYFSLAESPLCVVHGIFFVNSMLSLWLPFDQLWAPFGCPWVPFCSLWPTRWGPIGHPGAPVGSLCGIFWNLLKIGSRFPGKKTESLRLRTRIKSPIILPGIPAIPAIPAKWCQEPLLGPHLHTHRGPG